MLSNKLINESSPYLLQHAYNPVEWHPWNTEAFEKAKNENKLVIISIGYSACHWCHVMEHESFENTEVAEVMNKYFVSIKVDREERPDIDAVYMQAVQLMTGQGGWPLNVIALPDGKPVYGGTYFPKQKWISVLEQLNEFFRRDTERCFQYANELQDGVNKMSAVIKNDDDSDFSKAEIEKSVAAWKQNFDLQEGGPNRSPKFPMPNNYLFLLRHAFLNNDETLKSFVLLTLKKMAFGGIYDQLGGGFARYATDYKWKVPHFEKMLYDNAQLISLYSEAYIATKDVLFKNVVFETFAFIMRELASDEGSFYSALDADSEGVEGKFYVWQKEEIENLLGTDAELFCEYYNVNKDGLWEHGNNILLRNKDDAIIAAENKISTEALKAIINRSKKILLAKRNERIRPGLDDKQLTSWNALMIKGLSDAYRAFNDESFLNTAIRCADFIKEKVTTTEGKLMHSYKNDKATVNGFLEDYTFVIEAFISLYQVTLNEQWLYSANELTKICFADFYDEDAGMFLFSSKKDESLFSIHYETQDNVIPASNSALARSLFALGKYFGNMQYNQIAKQMLQNVKSEFMRYPSAYSNWGILLLNLTHPFFEICICGKDVFNKAQQLRKYYQPNTLLAGSKDNSSLSLLDGKTAGEETMIYVCFNNSCRQPVLTIEEAMQLMA